MLNRPLVLPSLLLCSAALALSGQAASAQTPAALATAPSHTHHVHTARRGQPTTKPAATLTEDERTLQVLNRFTFGPRPGDIARVRQAGGPEAWFEQQLEPERIPNAPLDQRLAQYPALELPTEQMLYNFPSNQDIRQVADGKRPMPQDPELAALYETLVTKYLDKRKQDDAAAQSTSSVAVATPQAAANAAVSGAASPPNPGVSGGDKAALRRQDQARAQALAVPILALPQSERMGAVVHMPVEDRIVLTANLADPAKAQLLAGFTPRERDLFAAMGGGPNAAAVIANQLVQAKVLRAILSERQLQEVMTDFWFNHFNVYLHKNQDSYYTASYERDAIRPHALGKFRDLLLATAQHPAMLVFLDNYQSIGADSVAANRQKNNPAPNAKQGAQRGLNENYGREVMELHTVGVNGCYSQADVTALSNILTGWTIDHPDDGGGFVFDPRRHEPGSKQWFGHAVAENGQTEGQQALAFLAAQPQTAHLISYKLAQRFVADDPSPALVERMAQTFLASDGDIRQVLRTMVHAPEFWARANYRNKVKTPLEFVASAFRATATDPANPSAIAGLLNRMGEPLYAMQTPTGYPMTADHWMNSAALVDRLNFSLALANDRFANTKFDAPQLLATGLLDRGVAAPGPGETAHPTKPQRVSLKETTVSSAAAPATPLPIAGPPAPGLDETLRLMERTLTGGEVSTKTDGVIHQQLAAESNASGPAATTQLLDSMTALILGSPEFQMR